MKRFESFIIREIDPDHGSMVGGTVDGKIREFQLVVNRCLATNELTVDVGRHFTTEGSIPHWPESGMWTEEEMRGQTE